MRISTLGSGTGERMADAQVLLQVRPVRARPQTMAGLAWWRFARHRMAVVGLVVVALLAAASALAPWLSPYDPDKPQLQLQLRAPSPVHPLGTDDLGRDLLTRIMYGGRISLSIGILAMGLADWMGRPGGAAPGYSGGAIDNGLLRFTNLMLSIPPLFCLTTLPLLLRSFPVPFWRGECSPSCWRLPCCLG